MSQTKAERATKSGKVPAALKEAAQQVSESCMEGYAKVEAYPDDFPDDIVPHAYSYQEMDDGSVLALYANTSDGEVKMVAFESMEDASAWSPRSEE